MLMNFANALPSTLEQGLIYALLAMGVLITYTILDFPDLSVDGTFPLGGIISTMVIAAGYSPLLALLAAIAGGAAAGLCTGLIHVKLKVRDLFSGIIVSTALYSINLKISGGKSLATIGRKDVTLFQNNPVAGFFSGLVGDFSTLVIIFLVVLVVKILLDLFLKTPRGLPFARRGRQRARGHGACLRQGPREDHRPDDRQRLRGALRRGALPAPAHV